MPVDVHLLPGQLKDIVEAIGDFRDTPPPLPSLPRPRTTPQGVNGNWSSARSGSSGDSTASGSFRGHLTYRGDAPNDGNGKGGTVGNLKQLHHRQTDLAFKTLDTEVHHTQNPGENGDYGQRQSRTIWSEFSFGAPNISDNNRRRDANQNYASNDGNNSDNDSDDLNPNPQEGPVRPLLPPQFRLDKNPPTIRAPPRAASPPPPPRAASPPPTRSVPPPPPPGLPPPASSHPDVQILTSELQSKAVFTARGPRQPTSPTTDPDKTFDARSQQNPGTSLRAVYR